MPDVSISKEELNALIEKVESKFFEHHNKVNTRFNSNTENYKKLKDHIVKIVEPDKELSLAFLRGLFYFDKNSGKQFFTYRDYTLDTLSEYGFGKKWENISEQIKENRIHIYSNKEFYLSYEDYSETETNYHIDSITFEEITKTLLEKEGKVMFHIDSSFLKTKRSAITLLKLFEQYNYEIGVEFDLKFNVSKSLLKGSDGDINEGEICIDNEIGIGYLLQYWQKTTNKIKLINKDFVDNVVDEKEYERLSGLENKIVLNALHALISKRVLNNKFFDAETQHVDILNPWLSLANNSKPISLRNIINDQPNLTGEEQFIFYCVISYRDYLSPKEKGEMLSYFYDFNTILTKLNHKISRLFSVPVIRKNKLNIPDLNLSEIEQLYQFILINLKTNAETYYFEYEKDSRIPPEILAQFTQDYVIRKEWKSDVQNSTSDSLYKDVLNEYLLSFKKQISNEENIVNNNKIYFAYPENYLGENRLIEEDSIHLIYKFLKDFSFRMKWRISEFSSFFTPHKIEDESSLDLIFLGFLGGDRITELKREVKEEIEVKENDEL